MALIPERKSIIDRNFHDITELSIPKGIGLSGGTPSLTPYKGQMGYDITLPSSLFIGDGTVWNSVVGGNTTDVTLDTFGTLPNSEGASLAGQVLTLQPASLTEPGGVSTSIQEFKGVKDMKADGIIISPFTTVGVISKFDSYLHWQGSVTWQGGIVGTVSTLIALERIGRTVKLSLIDVLDPGTTLAAIIECPTTLIPVEFRPTAEVVSNIWVINASQAGSSATIATEIGAVKLKPDGNIEIGLGVTNAGATRIYGSSSVGGSGNGFVGNQSAIFLHV